MRCATHERQQLIASDFVPRSWTERLMRSVCSNGCIMRCVPVQPKAQCDVRRRSAEWPWTRRIPCALDLRDAASASATQRPLTTTHARCVPNVKQVSRCFASGLFIQPDACCLALSWLWNCKSQFLEDCCLVCERIFVRRNRPAIWLRTAPAGGHLCTCPRPTRTPCFGLILLCHPRFEHQGF